MGRDMRRVPHHERDHRRRERPKCAAKPPVPVGAHIGGACSTADGGPANPLLLRKWNHGGIELLDTHLGAGAHFPLYALSAISLQRLAT
jgi:hypothetical protein